MPLRPQARISLPVARPAKVGPEQIVQYWHPHRIGASRAPLSFVKRLHDIDPNLEVTWSPIHERWLVWVRAPRMQHALCPGWRLLFIHHSADKGYLPLDERVFARIYQVDATTQGGAKHYFERIVAEMERDRVKREQKWQQETIDRAMPSFDHAQIRVSGYGKSSGNKFSTYHS